MDSRWTVVQRWCCRCQILTSSVLSLRLLVGAVFAGCRSRWILTSETAKLRVTPTMSARGCSLGSAVPAGWSRRRSNPDPLAARDGEVRKRGGCLLRLVEHGLDLSELVSGHAADGGRRRLPSCRKASRKRTDRVPADLERGHPRHLRALQLPAQDGLQGPAQGQPAPSRSRQVTAAALVLLRFASDRSCVRLADAERPLDCTSLAIVTWSLSLHYWKPM